MVDNFFSSDFGQTILLFVLIFTVIFAILQKSKILGDGKKQIDALVALSIALLVIGVSTVLDFTQKIIPVMAVAIVAILVFLILTAMFFKGDMEFGNGLKIAFGILMFIVVAISVIIFTGGWDWVKEVVSSSSAAGNVVLIIVILAVVAFAYFATGKDSK
jgi:hypothetical protein